LNVVAAAVVIGKNVGERECEFGRKEKETRVE